MRTAASILLLIGSLHCLAQGKPVNVQPHWLPLDTRTINTTTATKATLGDSLMQDASATSSFSVEVPELRKDVFFVTLRSHGVAPPVADMHGYTAALPAVFRDSVAKRMEQVVSDLYASMEQSETHYKMNLAGEIVEASDADKNKDALKPKMMDAANALLALNHENKQHTAQEVDAHAHALADSLFAVYAGMQDQMQLILAPFKITYPATGSSRKATTIKAPEVPTLGTLGELPAMMEYGLDEVTPKAYTARTVITCDADALLKALLAIDPKSTLKKSDVSLVQETVCMMDRTSGWLQKQTTQTRLRVGTLRAQTTATSVVTAK